MTDLIQRDQFARRHGTIPSRTIQYGRRQLIWQCEGVQEAWAQWLDSLPEEEQVALRRDNPSQVFLGKRYPQNVQTPERDVIRLWDSPPGGERADLGFKGHHDPWPPRTEDQEALAIAMILLVEQLTQKQQDAIRAVFHEGLSERDAAKKLGIERGSLRGRLEDAYASMRAKLPKLDE